MLLPVPDTSSGFQPALGPKARRIGVMARLEDPLRSAWKLQFAQTRVGVVPRGDVAPQIIVMALS